MVEQFFYEPKQNIFYICDDGHGDYNRSYEQYDRDIDYADYSTDHRDNNFFNIEKKKKKNEKILKKIKTQNKNLKNQKYLLVHTRLRTFREKNILK